MYQVAILLTTYNSSAYIRELFDSLLAQTYVHWVLYVRDDGSTDNTFDILCEYRALDSRICMIFDDKRRGACEGFLWLLDKAKGDFYMFCDHDDVWLPQKIEKTLYKMLGQKDFSIKPIAVCTDLTLVDSKLNVISDSMWRHCHFTAQQFNDKYFHLVYNNVTGCTMMINNKVKEIAFPYPESIIIHDSWIAAAVLWNGGRIETINEVTILYRQHEHNAIGAKDAPSYMSQLMKFKLLWKKTKRQHDTALQLVRMNFMFFFLMKLYYMVKIHSKC